MNKQQDSPQNNGDQDLPQEHQPLMNDPALTDSTTTQIRKTSFINPTILRMGVYAVVFIVIVLAVWGIGSLIVTNTTGSSEAASLPTPTTVSLPSGVATPIFAPEEAAGGVIRLSEIQSFNNDQPQADVRDEIMTYTVQAGDTIFGVAEMFGLKPETVLWSNRYTIGDAPGGLSIGQELVILPLDGVYHRWEEGEGLNGVASFYGVIPDEIVNYPGNQLDPEIVGDYANPNIEPGTMLVVPDGERPEVAWIVPRDNPASGSTYLGPGACGGIIYGDVGTGNFTWPVSTPYLSGFDFTPPVHNGLDFGGDSGHPIYAADSGVVVYSGWSDRGYGYLIVIDHDRGWQTFYAHLIGGTLVPCGSSVQKGQLIASMGSTGNSSGPHLHFELRLNGSPQNPWLFLN